jgi:uncharacterized protein YueI
MTIDTSNKFAEQMMVIANQMKMEGQISFAEQMMIMADQMKIEGEKTCKQMISEQIMKIADKMKMNGSLMMTGKMVNGQMMMDGQLNEQTKISNQMIKMADQIKSENNVIVNQQMTTKPIKKGYLLLFYIILTIILILIGYFLGNKFNPSKRQEYALYGALVGIVLSLILWFSWGKNKTI